VGRAVEEATNFCLIVTLKVSLSVLQVSTEQSHGRSRNVTRSLFALPEGMTVSLWRVNGG